MYVVLSEMSTIVLSSTESVLALKSWYNDHAWTARWVEPLVEPFVRLQGKAGLVKY